MGIALALSLPLSPPPPNDGRLGILGTSNLGAENDGNAGIFISLSFGAGGGATFGVSLGIVGTVGMVGVYVGAGAGGGVGATDDAPFSAFSLRFLRSSFRLSFSCLRRS